MVRHQTPGMQAAVKLVGFLGQRIEVVLIIKGVIEAGGTIIASLNDMPGDTKRARRGIILTSKKGIRLLSWA